MTDLLKQAIQYAVNHLTCLYCAGEGRLSSRITEIRGGPSFDWIDGCKHCGGTGVRRIKEE